MKPFLLAVVLLTAIELHAEVSAPSYSFRELASCADKGDPYRAQPRVRATRKSGRIVATVETSAGCSETAKPKVAFLGSAVSLWIEMHQREGSIAACLCSRKFEFTLLEPVRKGAAIYLVQNGNARAHVVAP